MPTQFARGRSLLVWAVGALALNCGSVPVIVLGDGPARCPAPTGTPVTLQRTGTDFNLSNGLIAMTIAANGQVTAMSKNGTALMAGGQTMYVSSSDGSVERFIEATTQTVVSQTPQRIELSFVDTNGSMNWALHYVMQSGLSGFYYYLVADTIGKAPIVLPELRTVQRFDPSIFVNGYNAERHGELPPAAVAAQMTAANQIQDNAWQLPDAGLLPGTPGPEGPVYTSYDWATYVAEDWSAGHGLYGNSFGVWLLTASPEYVTGGPMKQELMVDASIVLNVYNGAHFGTSISTRTPARWQKLYGPSLLYVNTGTDARMIADAATQAAAERTAWPYCWVSAPVFPIQRSTVDGTVSVTHGRSAAGSVVTLAQPGELYLQAYNYMYWSHADANGNFAIANVRPGTYAVHVYATEGDIAATASTAAAALSDAGADAGGSTDDSEEVASNVTVAPGATHLGALTWSPTYHPNSLWVIGTSDRTSGEFLVSGGHTARATLREYGPSATAGLWDIPPANLTYTIGTSTPAQNWYFAQSKVGTWSIVFGLDAALAGSAYLTLAIAGVSQAPKLAVTINGHAIFSQTFGNDETLYRSALMSGRYQLFTVPFPASYLTVGTASNTMAFGLNVGAGGGIMYDFIKLESD